MLRAYRPYLLSVLSLFPLGTVLFPGLLLPLHVFEERYRDLVRDLLELPEEERQFGVIAIREGREVDADGITALYDVGCTARLRQVESYEDGRFDLVTVGSQRFRLRELHEDRPYLTGEVDWLPDDPGDLGEAQVLSQAVRTAFGVYLGALSQASGQGIEAPELPAEPLVLSHLVGATMLLDLADRQDLLAQPDGRSRLRRELSLLRREAGFLHNFAAAPAPELARSAVYLN